MREAHLDGLLLNLLGGAHRATLMHGGQVFEPLYAVGLQTTLVLVELGAADPTPSISLQETLPRASARAPTPKASLEPVSVPLSCSSSFNRRQDSTAQAVKNKGLEYTSMRERIEERE